ncbi:type II toxin-antitoxin system VapB family antitoxin [Mariniluteicoccus flavus]
MATMNIKDPLVHELAHELATLRGSSATAAVRAALEEALDHERHRHIDRPSALRALQDSARSTSDQWLTDDDLYDTDGLPR